MKKKFHPFRNTLILMRLDLLSLDRKLRKLERICHIKAWGRLDDPKRHT